MVTEGGIKIPNVPPAAIEPVATELGYPRLRISGIPNRPMVAHVAGLDPVIPEKIAQAPILDSTNPPGTLNSQRSKERYKSPPPGVPCTREPNSTKSGLTT